MPTSESASIQISTMKKWCEIKENTSTIHVRKPSGQTTTLNLTAEMLLSDGSIRSNAVSVYGTQWNTLSINTTDAIACNLYYGGSTGATFYIYFS